MGSFIYGLGKGLREPVSPYREDYIFGADLNDFNADNWGAIPVVIESTTTFNLSTISPGHEVVVALAGVSGALAGTYTVRFEWRRDRDNALLYQFSFNRTMSAGGWLYGYSYIGYVDWEINENGGYYVDIEVSGPEYFTRRISFTITGIPEEVPVPPPGGNFLDSIFSLVWDMSQAVFNAYSEVKEWVWPFNLLQYPLYALYLGFWNLLTPISQFGDWFNDVTASVANILDFSNIWDYFRPYFEAAYNAWQWVIHAFSNVSTIVDTWWGSVSQTVQAWIETLGDELRSYINSILSIVNPLIEAWTGFAIKIPTIDELIAWWSNWPGQVLRWIESWWTGRLQDIQDLINSAFAMRDNLWAGWQELRDQVVEFFSDPVEFVWTKFTDWFLGPEE